VRVAGERAEEARAAMLELFPEGFEEVDVTGGIELAAYTNAGGEERLWHVFGPGRAEEVGDGWLDSWKRFHRPLRIGRLWIGPPWEAPDRDAIPVVIDPGRAFGTGAHPTTRLCLELLLEATPGALLDLGCGSGVLSIAAAKLGFCPVTALDLDPLAAEAASANAVVNGVDVDVMEGDVLLLALPRADVAVANIALDRVEEVACVAPVDRLITSGYLVSECPAPSGWTSVDRRESQAWAADVFERR
jgi:ribosomal protein L11 methyltransferase